MFSLKNKTTNVCLNVANVYVINCFFCLRKRSLIFLFKMSIEICFALFAFLISSKLLWIFVKTFINLCFFFRFDDFCFKHFFIFFKVFTIKFNFWLFVINLLFFCFKFLTRFTYFLCFLTIFSIVSIKLCEFATMIFF